MGVQWGQGVVGDREERGACESHVKGIFGFKCHVTIPPHVLII